MRRNMEMLKLLLYCAMLANLCTGCRYASVEYEEGATVPTEEPCLNCACTRGSLVCHLRVCPSLPEPPPRGCLIVHKNHKCCPQLVCEHGFNEDLSNSIEARSGLMSLPELNETSKGCVINGTVYGEGSATDTSSLCQYCYCIRGVQHCVQPKCLLKTPGCSPVYNQLACCPTKYNCTGKTVGPPPKPIGEEHAELALLEGYKGCSIDGKHYLEGDKVDGITNSSCVNCYCIAGKITCEQIICTPPVKHNCKPVYHADHCCPISYDCKQNSIKSNTSTTIEDTISTSTTEVVHKSDESSLDYYANISSVNINKNTLDTDSDSGMENRIIPHDEPELNRAQPKTPTESSKPPNSRISNNTILKFPNKNNMMNVRKPMEKHNNNSSHILLSTSSANKKPPVNLSNKVVFNNKTIVNNSKNHTKTSNKTSSVNNNKIKTQFNGPKNNSVTNKVVNKIISQSLMNTSNKNVSAAHNMQANKIKRNSTSNNLNKMNNKTYVPLRLNQSNIIKPNVEQLLKSQPNRFQGNIVKNNTKSNNLTKEYVKLPTKTAVANKTAPILTTSSTKYEKISSSNDLTKNTNSSTKSELSTSSSVNETKMEHRTGNETLNESIEEKPLANSTLVKTNETITKVEKTEVNVTSQKNDTKADIESTTLSSSSVSNITKDAENSTLTTSSTSTENSNPDNATSSDNIHSEALTTNETLVIQDDELETTNETIVERTKVGSIDSLENNATSSNVTAGSTVRASMSNKSVDLDYDYDSLPPSLPNLKIIPFVAADAVVDETNNFKQREDTESIIAITESPSYLDPFSNFFSPPVRTEGGFRPKEPILDGPYFESKIETTSALPGPVILTDTSDELVVAHLSSSTTSPDLSIPLITFTEFSTDRFVDTDYHCLFSSKVYKHGELVSHIDDCKVCVCFYGDIACQEPKCPEVSAGCRRVDSHGGCCGKIECDSNDITSTHIKDRFDEDAEINFNSTSDQHRIEYIHLSEHQMNPTLEHGMSSSYDTLESSVADDSKYSYVSTTEEPSIEYISNNKYVIVKPTPNKQTHQTTTYKSILDDILPYFWQDEGESNVQKSNLTNSMSNTESSQDDTSLKVQKNNVNESFNHYNQFNNNNNKNNNNAEGNETVTHISHLDISNKVKTDTNKNHYNTQNEKTSNPNTPSKGGSEEDLFSSLLHSFSSMYSSLDNQKQKSKPGSKNNVRIKPVVPHKPSVKTTNEDLTNHQNSYSSLGAFSSSTIKTTTLFIPILRYNSTATKYYSVLETTPEHSNKNVVPNYIREDFSGEIPSATVTEVSNRVTQPPQEKHIVQNNRHKVKLPISSTEAFLVPSKTYLSETTYSYFQESDIFTTTDRVKTDRIQSSTNQMRDTVSQKPDNIYYSQEKPEILGHVDDFESTSYPEKTTKSELLETKKKLESPYVNEHIETSTFGHSFENNDHHRSKTTSSPLTVSREPTINSNKAVPITEKEPDLFSELLGNFFETNEQDTNMPSNKTEQNIVTTTTTPVKKNIVKTTTTDKPPVKDDFEEDFSLDSVLSYWFNTDESTPSSRSKMPKQDIESRIDTNVDDSDDGDVYDDEYNGEFDEDTKNTNSTIKQNSKEIDKRKVSSDNNKNSATDSKVELKSQNETNLKFENVTLPSTTTKLKNTETYFHVSNNSNELISENNNSFVTGKTDKQSLNSSVEDLKEHLASKSTLNTSQSMSNKNLTKESIISESDETYIEPTEKSSQDTSEKTYEQTMISTDSPNLVSETTHVNKGINNIHSQTTQKTESTPFVQKYDSTTTKNTLTTQHFESKELPKPHSTVNETNNKNFTENKGTETVNSNTQHRDKVNIIEKSPEKLVPLQTRTKPNVPSQSSGYKPHPPVPTTYKISTSTPKDSFKPIHSSTTTKLSHESTHSSTTPKISHEPYSFSTPKPIQETVSTTRRYFPTKRPQFYRPSTYRPKVKFPLPPRTSPRPTAVVTSSTPSFNPLKIDECNIYGSIYKVGTSIAELSTECLTCLCTSLGVQCSSRCVQQ